MRAIPTPKFWVHAALRLEPEAQPVEEAIRQLVVAPAGEARHDLQTRFRRQVTGPTIIEPLRGSRTVTIKLDAIKNLMLELPETHWMTAK